MKKTFAALTVLIFAFVTTSCDKAFDKNFSVPVSQTQNVIVHKNENTKIANDFAEQLPDFHFNNPVENFDESIRFVFSVKSDENEFDDYVEALKSVGFAGGTEGHAVSDFGYYKAVNAERYMVEAVLANGVDLTVTVTRP